MSQSKVAQSKMRETIIETFKLIENDLKRGKDKLLRMLEIQEVNHQKVLTEKNDQIIKLNKGKSILQGKLERSQQELKDANRVIHKLSADQKLRREATPEIVDNEDNSVEVYANNNIAGDASGKEEPVPALELTGRVGSKRGRRSKSRQGVSQSRTEEEQARNTPHDAVSADPREKDDQEMNPTPTWRSVDSETNPGICIVEGLLQQVFLMEDQSLPHQATDRQDSPQRNPIGTQKRTRTCRDWAAIFGKKRKVGGTQEEQNNKAVAQDQCAPHPGLGLKATGKRSKGGEGVASVDQGGMEAPHTGALAHKGMFLPPCRVSLGRLAMDAFSNYTRCAVRVQVEKTPQTLLKSCLKENQ